MILSLLNINDLYFIFIIVSSFLNTSFMKKNIKI